MSNFNPLGYNEEGIHENTIELRELRDRHKLSSKTIAEIVDRKRQTVLVWLQLKSARPIPDRQLKIIKRFLNEQ